MHVLVWLLLWWSRLTRISCCWQTRASCCIMANVLKTS